VGEEPADRDALLAVGRELRPVGGDGRVEVELAALGQQVGAGGDDALGRGVDDLQGVALPGAAGPRVGDAAPQVDDLPAVQVDADRRAHLLVAGQIRRERRAYSVESRCGGPADFGHASSPSVRSCR
jgi:hypothetical protein